MSGSWVEALYRLGSVLATAVARGGWLARCGCALTVPVVVACTSPPDSRPAAPGGAPPSSASARTTGAPHPAVPVNVTLSAPGLSPQDIEAITSHHNKVRAEVGVGPLTWSPVVAAHAQLWAEQLAISDCRMKHRSPNVYGENLFQGTFGAFTAVDAAKAWETEKKDYRGGPLTDLNWAPAAHYTQMVWRETSTLGCGQAICNKTLIVACNYEPAGNVLGRKPY